MRGIDIEIVFKDIKNLHIGVYPPSGRVRVAAPRRLDEDRVRLAVIQRLPWIKQQRQQFLDAARQSEREMASTVTNLCPASASSAAAATLRSSPVSPAKMSVVLPRSSSPQRNIHVGITVDAGPGRGRPGPRLHGRIPRMLGAV